ncbi:MAG: hypothetical protein DI629_17015 [Mesorhizobium amorphae]|nr:MAG: hypothetical protein DI629_17015 [Mesorhizobium amorphae]
MRSGVSAPTSSQLGFRESSGGLGDWARSVLKRLAGLGLMGAVGLGTGALATWNVADPSFSHATDAPVSNALGYPGAVFADIAAQFWGLAALAAMVPVAWWGLTLARAHPIHRVARRLLAAFGFSVVAAGIAGCFAPTPTWPLPTGLGGVFGDVVLWLPSLVLGGYPQGFVGLPVAGLLAAPALWLFAYAVGLLGRGPLPEREGRGALVPHDEEDDDSVGIFGTVMGNVAHWWLFMKARSRRRLAGLRDEAVRPAVQPANPLEGRGWRRAAERVEEAELAENRHPADPRTRARIEPEFFAAMLADANKPIDAVEPVERTEEPSWEDQAIPMADELSLSPEEIASFDDQIMPAPEPEDLMAEFAPAAAFVEPPRPRTPVGPNTQVRAYRTPSPSALREAALREEERRLGRAQGIEPSFAEPLLDDEGTSGEPMPFAELDDEMDDLHLEPFAMPEAPAPVPAQPAALPRVKIPAPSRPLPSLAPQPAATAAPVAPAVAAAMPAQVQRAVAREFGPRMGPNGFEMPALSFLSEPKSIARDPSLSEAALQANARRLEGVLEDFGVKGEIIQVRPGPVVTLYELEPAPGIKSSRVIGLADDIARSMSAIAARVAVVPGRNAIGIELPNPRRETVFLREMLASQDFMTSKAKLALALGKTINGEAVVTDIAKFPHVLVAGTTGSGKSVAINTMVLSLLYRLTPDQCRLIMIDPKMVELSVYDGIPHLLTPVVTDPKKAVVALKWTVREMEDRYRKMAKLSVRNVDGFNARVAQAAEKGETITRTVQTGFDKQTGEAVYETEEFDLEPLPYIVVIIDEVADLMMVAGKDIEGAVQRLGQMARAAGIHVIMATQRPSVDVITGTIKANFPTRISFAVTSKIDSRTILGEMGAEQLLGQGDMLFMAGGGRVQRVHGPFVSDDEVEKVVSHLKLQGVPEYLDAIIEDDEEDEDDDKPAKGGGASGSGDNFDDSDDPYDQAVAVVLRDGKASTSYIQRRLGIGYNRAASLIERMEKEGIVGAANHAGKREILVPTEDDKM